MERLTDEQKAKVEEFAKQMQDVVIPSIVQTQQERHFAAIKQAITDPMTPPGVSGAYTALLKHIQELEEELAWWGGLVKRACIGTAQTPSLKAYIEQQEAALAAKDQQVQAWQMAYEGVQRQLAEQDQLIKELEEHERQTHERLGKILGTDDSLEECARRLRGELQYAKQTAVQDFIHGRSKLCLICGAKEPCVLKDDPSSPCTFDPTPIELLEYNRKLRELLAAKDQELARVKAHADQQGRYAVEMFDALKAEQRVHQTTKQAHDTLLGEAVWAMEIVLQMYSGPAQYARAEKFLVRPDVKAWQERQKEAIR